MPPKVAPYDSCIACYRGDVTTAVAFQGEAEFVVAGIRRATGIPLEQAEATFMAFAENELGCDPGMVPTGRITQAVRLCVACAMKAGTEVGPVAGDVPCLRTEEGMMADDLRDIPHSLQRMGDEVLRMADKAKQAVAEESDPNARRILEESVTELRDLARRTTTRAAIGEEVIAEDMGDDTASR